MNQLNKADIRDILMSNGFTIKKDQNDLKDYVFGAAEALLHAARQVPMPAPALSDDVKACIERATANQEEDRPYKALDVALQYGFEYVDDDATILQVRDVDLTNLMSVLGFRRRRVSGVSDEALLAVMVLGLVAIASPEDLPPDADEIAEWAVKRIEPSSFTVAGAPLDFMYKILHDAMKETP